MTYKLFFKRILCLLLCFPLVLSAAKLLDIQGMGIKNEILLNVEHRLLEGYQGKSLLAQPEDELKSEITKALEPYGYFKPQVVIISQKKHLKIIIHRGPQIHIRSLQIHIVGEGALNPEIQRSLHNIPIRTGQIFETIPYEITKNALSNTAEAQGYLHASYTTAQVLLDPNQNTADILLVLDTGPRYYFGQIQFDPTTISPDLLKRYVPFKRMRTGKYGLRGLINF